MSTKQTTLTNLFKTSLLKENRFDSDAGPPNLNLDCLKTVYFVAGKKWAVRENFSDIIHLLKGLGDENIFYHLQQALAKDSYISTTSTDGFLKCL